ncbi:MAG TPA: HlyD family secretion protein, partial [Usitatibacter sp.]|nr:HlyD family secretion protein [Usitatibacter sp.]
MATVAESTPPLAPAPAPARKRRPQRRHLKWIVAAVVLAAAAIFGYRFWRDASLFVSTDNAYIQANQAEITSQVAGQVTAVHVRDQQQVRQGDPLFDVDARNFQLAVERAKAELAQRRAEAANAENLYRRNQKLQASGFLSPQGAETSRAQMASAEAAVQVANAALKQAELDLDRVHVKSPTAGTIANMTLRPGNMVQPGTPLFVVISDQEFWVDANFKETELRRVKPGQEARVVMDMYPRHEFKGVVQSLAGGAGQAFSL